uniref:Uncharacterized protein n=1 Tax=Plectus sambesii TaxID=2011161 RepID=A0A914XRH5_9BILA
MLELLELCARVIREVVDGGGGRWLLRTEAADKPLEHAPFSVIRQRAGDGVRAERKRREATVSASSASGSRPARSPEDIMSRSVATQQLFRPAAIADIQQARCGLTLRAAKCVSRQTTGSQTRRSMALLARPAPQIDRVTPATDYPHP